MECFPDQDAIGGAELLGNQDAQPAKIALLRTTPKRRAVMALSRLPLQVPSQRFLWRLLNAISMARSIAGCAMFLILTQSRQRPER